MKLSVKVAMIAATVILLSATSVFAQEPKMRIHVPFAFEAGGARLPAGDYRVSRDTLSQWVVLANERGSSIFLSTHHPFIGEHVKENGSLTFDKYGDSYFLRKVSTPGTGAGYEFPVSRAERETAKLGIPGEVASVEVGSR